MNEARSLRHAQGIVCHWKLLDKSRNPYDPVMPCPCPQFSSLAKKAFDEIGPKSKTALFSNQDEIAVFGDGRTGLVWVPYEQIMGMAVKAGFVMPRVDRLQGYEIMIGESHARRLARSIENSNNYKTLVEKLVCGYDIRNFQPVIHA